jgi:hypothetical protein
MAQKRLNYVPGLLNNLNLPTPYPFTEPITGLPIPGSGLVLGDVMSITAREAYQLAQQPGVPSPFPLYEGDYQFVQVDAAATAANVQRGYVAFFLALPPTPPQLGALPPGGNIRVTDGSHAANINLVTGIFLNAITPGNFGFIQIAGRASVYSSAAGTVGEVINAVASGQGTPSATTTGPGFLGYIYAAIAAAGIGQVKLQMVSAQQ